MGNLNFSSILKGFVDGRRIAFSSPYDTAMKLMAKFRSFTGLKCILECQLWSQKSKVQRCYISIIMVSKTISGQTLLLSTLVRVVPFGGHALWERYEKTIDPCLYYSIVSLFHASYIKLIKSLKFKGVHSPAVF